MQHASREDWKEWLDRTVCGGKTHHLIWNNFRKDSWKIHSPTHTQPTLDGSFSSETKARGEAAATTLPPPSEKEQQQMALLWAMEEVNSPKGWDEEEELDYSAVSRRREEERKENGKHCF